MARILLAWKGLVAGVMGPSKGRPHMIEELIYFYA